jgi:SsrA-binding protein
MEKDSSIAVNRKAFHDYHILETVESGIVLTGTEIKSVRAHQVNLREAYARIQNGEMWLFNSHIAGYDPGSRNNHDPVRNRKLLLHRKQIDHLFGELTQKGLTLVPLRMYIKRGTAKLELGLGKGKKLYDKREAIAKREVEREVDRTLKEFRRS